MKDKVALYFDSIAGNWDKRSNPPFEILEKIADIAGISEGKTVLDVGCGTGVMTPVFLKRNVKHITALDISQKMLDAAKEKYGDKRISFICGDISSFVCEDNFDCVIVHNAFPHFLRQKEALENLEHLTKKGGTLTVAHSISRAEVLKCHENVPEISVKLPEAHMLGEMLGSGFEKFTIISDDRIYIVSATRRL